MMIIRLGNIFPPLTFPSDFPDSPHVRLCVCVSRWHNSGFFQESREWWSRRLLLWQKNSPAMKDLSSFILFPHLFLLSLAILGYPP